uniref:Uncharacterized protein n=1 Tax=Anguilla anguilla TaxID=7936 RepID=A0A0E9UNU6_ANGAN
MGDRGCGKLKSAWLGSSDNFPECTGALCAWGLRPTPTERLLTSPCTLTTCWDEKEGTFLGTTP